MDFEITRRVHRLLATKSADLYFYVVDSGGTLTVVEAARDASPPTGWVDRSRNRATAELLVKTKKARSAA